MNVTIDGKRFFFDPKSEVKTEAGGCDLYVTEPGFDKSSREVVAHFTSKSINLPSRVEAKVRRVGLKPCSRVYEDSCGRKRLYAYFD